jgi:hypothetical protein
MKKLLKPASLLMYVLVILVFFMAGMTITGISGVAKGQGLAGGAIVFFYGVVTAIIAFILSLFVAYKMQIGTIIKINKILGIIFIFAACLFTYRVIKINKKETSIKELPTKVTSPAADEISMLPYKSLKRTSIQNNLESSLGIGFFKPNYFETPILYFYGGVNLEKSIIEHTTYRNTTFIVPNL